MEDGFDQDLGELFGDGGEDLLSLLDSVQDSQNKGLDGVVSEVKTEESTSSDASLGSSEDAYQKLMGTLLDIEKDIAGGDKPEVHPVPVVNMSDYDKAVYGFAQLDEIEKGVKRGLNVSFYDSADLNFRQMREIRIGLEHDIDVSFYSSKYYKDSQMREIRLGLMMGLDVSRYARLIYSLPDMQRMRMEAMKTRYNKDPDSMDFMVTDFDTGIVIYTTDQLMNAYIQVKKDLPNGFSRKNLQNLLKIYGIEYGLKLEELDFDALKPGSEEHVAEGEPSIQGENGWYEYLVDDLSETTPTMDENGNIDYMAQKQFCYTTPGQKVAIYHPATQGKRGRTVVDMELPAASGKNLSRLSLEKIRILEDGLTYVSKKEGYVTLKNGILNIEEQLEFKEDLGYGKNISYNGNIYVRANVLEGAIIQAGGDIVIDGFVESAHLKAGRDIVIRHGVNMDNKGRIEAEGKVVSSFLENAVVVAGGDVEANYIMNSQVVSKEKVRTTGSKNMICGGRVIGGKGVETGTIGNKYNVPTTVEAGFVSEMQERFSVIYKRKKQLDAEMQKVMDGMAIVLRKVGALNGRTNPTYLKLQDVLEQQKKEMAALDQSQEELDQESTKASRLFIVVGVIIYEGSKLVINGNARILKEDIVKARFFSKGKEIGYEQMTGGMRANNG